jgi:hypothetical protein
MVEISQNWLRVFPFSLSCAPVSSDQSVFITMARDLLSFGFSLFVMNEKGILSQT